MRSKPVQREGKRLAACPLRAWPCPPLNAPTRPCLPLCHACPRPPVAGVFVLSLAAAAEERHVLSALLFATLLNLKHIFLYAAPAFFVFLLRRYCR